MTEIINVGNPVINLYLIPCGEGYCLLDTGYKWQYDKFKKAMQKRAIPLEKIKYIVITHMHADHVGFLKELLAVTNALLIYDTDDKQRLEAGKNNLDTFISRFIYLLTSKISAAMVETMQSFPAVFYDNYVDAKTQPLKEFGMEFIPLKGHTKHDLCLCFEDKIFCGDVFMRGVGSSKYSPMWINNKYDLLDSWRVLSERKEEYIYPSHGKPFLRKDISKAIKYWKERGVFKLYPKK